MTPTKSSTVTGRNNTRDAVHADQVVDVQAGDPGRRSTSWKPGVGGVEGERARPARWPDPAALRTSATTRAQLGPRQQPDQRRRRQVRCRNSRLRQRDSRPSAHDVHEAGRQRAAAAASVSSQPGLGVEADDQQHQSPPCRRRGTPSRRCARSLTRAPSGAGARKARWKAHSRKPAASHVAQRRGDGQQGAEALDGRLEHQVGGIEARGAGHADDGQAADEEGDRAMKGMRSNRPPSSVEVGGAGAAEDEADHEQHDRRPPDRS